MGSEVSALVGDEHVEKYDELDSHHYTIEFEKRDDGWYVDIGEEFEIFSEDTDKTDGDIAIEILEEYSLGYGGEPDKLKLG